MDSKVSTYIFQALDAYPHYLEEAVEALQYALAYDENNATALGLMGQIYAESIKSYEVAKSYFEKALAADLYALDVYPKYVDVLLWNEDYDEAEKLIDFALSVKGTDKAILYVKKGILFEHRFNYDDALKCIEKAKKFTYNNEFLEELKEERSRIKKKMNATQKKKEKPSKAKETPSKKKELRDKE